MPEALSAKPIEAMSEAAAESCAESFVVVKVDPVCETLLVVPAVIVIAMYGAIIAFKDFPAYEMFILDDEKRTARGKLRRLLDQ